jgi:glycosyltransferase involved in cell wall biosynthesis
MQDIFAFASATLIHLRDDRLTRVGIPQKTQAYMAAGRPIIAAVRGDTAALVKRSQAGLTCESENSTSIAKAVKTLLNMSEDERESLSKKGIDFYEKELSLKIGVKKIESILQKIVAENLCTSS